MTIALKSALAGAAILLGAGLASAQDAGTIRIGFFPGPYADQFIRGIQPGLEEQGYEIELTEFSNAIQPNTALMDGSLDVNIFMNDGFRELFNSQNSGDLVTLLHIPSAPLGLYSLEVDGLDGISEGMSISVPNDPTNLGRALMFLEELELIDIDDAVDPSRATERDIVDNPMNLEIVPLDAPQIMRAMQDVDLAAALGNHVLASGNSLSDAIVLEDPAIQYQIIIAAREGARDALWAQDLVAAYQSDAFREFLQSDPATQGFSTPDYWR
jgi:D-methionine transport system substrate-binding protein